MGLVHEECSLHVKKHAINSTSKGKEAHETEEMESKSPTSAFIFVVILLCLLLPSNAASLHPDEAKALLEIAKELGKTDWNFSTSVDPCNDISWKSQCNPQKKTSYVNCLNCTCSRDVCHVHNITLKGQNLTGTLPKSLANLTRLKVIDLTRNYLTGSIPREWTSIPLEYMSVIVNRLFGPIPKHLGNIKTLTYLSIESNRFSGTVPAELGLLVNLQSLTLSSNNLIGQLPNSLNNLSNLIDFRISDNNFSGQFPDHFRSWRALKNLEILGSGFRGPIPSSISGLTKLIELRISDLDGEGSDFPDLQNMTNLTKLVLRNCNISGSIPSYLPKLTTLKILDLSFNKLNGPIPQELGNLKDTLENLYLTNNYLSGPISEWIKNTDDKHKIDLSYNNFDESSLPPLCKNQNLNIFRSSSRKLNSSLAVCLEKNFPCSQAHYFLHINCGGSEIKIGKNTYKGDNDPGGAAKFIPVVPEWGFSSTGEFWNLKQGGDYIEKNDSIVNVTDAELYTEARISALSLTYYGRCLAPGNYSVTLYFSEIVFKNSHTYLNLGRRIFDVYIQERLILHDFDIVKAASGAEKAYNRTFKNISVTETGTIEIRFYYAGKGTTAVPVRGVYGPLISAISVESEFSPPYRKKIIEIVIGSTASLIFLLIVAYGVFIWRMQQRSGPSKEEVLRGIDLQTGYFTYKQIKAATDNFDPANKIGQGGFGSVYRGTLLDGAYIAVKQLSSKSSQGNREFVTEIGMISGLHHPNLVRLYGCCVEGSQLFLVYEYMVNNNLARALFDEEWPLRLDWPTRQKVCTEIATSLVFLHEESAIRIIHRDIKPTNVLLDENMNAKISDFGLARLREEEDTHISTRIAGTIGYMSPEYALWGYLTSKADVYSFGVVALEIVAGRSNMDFKPDDENFCLLDWAMVQERKGNVMEIIDVKLGSEYNKEEAVRMIKIALLCTNPSPALRPTMSQVVTMLQGNISLQESTMNPTTYGWMSSSNQSSM